MTAEQIAIIRTLGLIPTHKRSQKRLSIDIRGAITSRSLARVWGVSVQTAYDRASRICAMGKLIRIKQGYYRLPDEQKQKEST